MRLTLFYRIFLIFNLNENIPHNLVDPIEHCYGSERRYGNAWMDLE